jgi:hypothetical protein
MLPSHLQISKVTKVDQPQDIVLRYLLDEISSDVEIQSTMRTSGWYHVNVFPLLKSPRNETTNLIRREAHAKGYRTT